ncbi:MAG: hypothetical protein AB1644_01910 [Candidatus Zixiibacteriota bacterium]
MNRFQTILASALGLVGLVGCDDNNQIFDPVPATPQGVYSVTGDQAVYVYFNGVYESDIREYRVYRSLQATTDYTQIGTVAADPNPNLDLLIYEFIDAPLTNGTTYYYAVTAVDDAGHESDLSAEEVFDTPRPEGETVLFPNTVEQSLSGFSFAAHAQVPDTSPAADIFIDIFQGTYYLNARDIQTDIQDMGYTSDFDEIGYSPANGWSDLGFIELIPGHTYVVWTRDSHYAKLRVVAIQTSSGAVNCQWAYQTAVDNRELVAPFPGEQKPVHGRGYLRHQTTSESSTR